MQTGASTAFLYILKAEYRPLVQASESVHEIKSTDHHATYRMLEDSLSAKLEGYETRNFPCKFLVAHRFMGLNLAEVQLKNVGDIDLQLHPEKGYKFSAETKILPTVKSNYDLVEQIDTSLFFIGLNAAPDTMFTRASTQVVMGRFNVASLLVNGKALFSLDYKNSLRSALIIRNAKGFCDIFTFSAKDDDIILEDLELFDFQAEPVPLAHQ